MIARKDPAERLSFTLWLRQTSTRSQRTPARGTALSKTPRLSNRPSRLVTRDHTDCPESEAVGTSPGSKENAQTIPVVASDRRLDQAEQSAGPLEQDKYHQD